MNKFAKVILNATNCSVCPRNCNANRQTQLGFCKAPNEMKVAKIIVIGNKVYAYGIALHDNVKSTLDDHNPDKSLRNKDLKGLIFIYDIVFENDEWSTGRIYHTDQGSSYYVKISLSEDKIHYL